MPMLKYIRIIKILSISACLVTALGCRGKKKSNSSATSPLNTPTLACTTLSDENDCNARSDCQYFFHQSDSARSMCIEKNQAGTLCPGLEEDKCLLKNFAQDTCEWVAGACQVDEYAATGFNGAGFDRNGFDRRGFNGAGGHKNGGLLDGEGYNAAGNDINGFNRAGIHQLTGNKFSPANVDIDGFNRSGFNAAGQNRGGHAQATLAVYAGSEAQALKLHYEFRGGGPKPYPQTATSPPSLWVTKYVFNGQVFDNTINPLSDWVVGYKVTDAPLANRIQVALGVPFAQNEILSDFEMGFINDAVLLADLEGYKDDIVNGDPSPLEYKNEPNLRNQQAVANVPPLPVPQQQYKQYLLNSIETKRQALGIVVSANADDYAHVSPTDARIDVTLMANIFDAIEHNNEVKFIKNMARFYGLYGANNIQGRAFFLDSFAEFFITKQFSSKELRASYFHFILRCGQIQ